MENATEEAKVIVVYKTYTPAQKKSQQKYYEKNKQKIIDRNVNYYFQKKDSDEYKMNKSVYNRNYREKKKLLKQREQDA